MKRIISILAIAIIAVTSMSAQNFTEGSSQFKAQVGLLSSYHDVKVPPISLNYECCAVDFGDAGSIGVGGIIGFMAFGDEDITVSDISFGATGSYHFTFPSVPALELYSGLMMYYNVISAETRYSWLDDIYEDQGFGCDYFLGAQYFFNDKMGASLQFGGMATMSAGLTFKF